jgi:GNAT superfamily N-acetyltransferase
VNVRLATERDLPAILRMLSGDRATASDELSPEAPCSANAFREIQASGHSATYVAEENGRVVGTFMLSFLRHLMRRGTMVAQLEAVRVDSSARGHGIGEQMVRWAIAESRRRGCSRIQLTSHKSRTAAHRFYERLGFEATHEGMKLPLE